MHPESPSILVIEAIAHPLPFLASFSNIVLTLCIAYIAYTLEARTWSLILVAILPILLGSVSSTAFLLGMVIFYWNSIGVNNDIMRNCVIISSGSFGLFAFAIRCRELYIPLLTTPSQVRANDSAAKRLLTNSSNEANPSLLLVAVPPTHDAYEPAPRVLLRASLVPFPLLLLRGQFLLQPRP